jgi:hypothetical protein
MNQLSLHTVLNGERSLDEVVKNAGRSDSEHVKFLYLLCLVKGIWEKEPDDWPSSVPFVDPNNNIVKSDTGSGKGSKPKKAVLKSMLEHLVKKYIVIALQLFFLLFLWIFELIFRMHFDIYFRISFMILMYVPIFYAVRLGGRLVFMV